MKTKHKRKDFQIGWHLILCISVCALLFPILFAVCNSFKTNQEAINSVMRLFPKNPTLENYIHVFDTLPFVQITCNTFIIAAVVTSLKTITSLFAAYAFVYFDFKGKGILYFFMLSTMFIPLVLYMIFQRYIINTFAMSGIKG